MEEKFSHAPSAPPYGPPSRDGRPAMGGPPPGAMGPAAGVSAPAAPSRKTPPRKIVLPIALVLILVVGVISYRFWWDQTHYVSTDNAQVAGTLVQAGTINAGRIDSLNVEIGEEVQQEQVIGTVLLPTTLNTTQSGVPRLGFVGSENQRAEIKAPITGVVVARTGNVGDTVAAGQPLATLADTNKLWVQAQIEETKIGLVRVGQPVEVKVDSLGQTLSGQVMAINRASAATFSLLPASNSSGNYTKVTQLVQVKIALDYGTLPLVMGSSVEVHIRVKE